MSHSKSWDRDPTLSHQKQKRRQKQHRNIQDGRWRKKTRKYTNGVKSIIVEAGAELFKLFSLLLLSHLPDFSQTRGRKGWRWSGNPKQQQKKNGLENKNWVNVELELRKKMPIIIAAIVQKKYLEILSMKVHWNWNSPREIKREGGRTYSIQIAHQ